MSKVLGGRESLIELLDLLSISSILIACSRSTGYLYEQFVTAVIFIAITNPYSVGDRIVINEDRVLFVKQILTYTTEFNDIYNNLVRQQAKHLVVL